MSKPRSHEGPSQWDEIITGQFDVVDGVCGRCWSRGPAETVAQVRRKTGKGVSPEEWFGTDVFKGRHLNPNYKPPELGPVGKKRGKK